MKQTPTNPHKIMARPRQATMRKIQQSFSLNPVVIDAIFQEAAQRGISASQLVEDTFTQNLGITRPELNADAMSFDIARRERTSPRLSEYIPSREELSPEDWQGRWDQFRLERKEHLKIQKTLLDKGVDVAEILKPLPATPPDGWNGECPMGNDPKSWTT